MKQLIVLADFPSHGGTKTFIELLCQFLADNNVQYRLAMMDSPVQRMAYEQLNVTNSKSPLWIKGRLSGIRRFLYRWPMQPIWDRIEMSPVLRESPDGIIVSTGNPWNHIYLLRGKVPAVYFLHTVPVYPPGGRPLGKLLPFLAQRFREGPHRFVGVSDFHTTVIRSLLSSKSMKVERIYNTTAQSDAAHHKRSLSAARAHHSGPLTVVTLGHVVDYKGVDLWWKVASSLIQAYPQRVRFRWIGDGPLFAYYQEKSRSFPDIDFPGASTDPGSILRNTDIYFQPSRRESLGIAVLEAMEYGIPCVVSDCQGLPETIRDGSTGFVFGADDAERGMQCLETLIRDQSLRDRMGHAAREFFHAQFSPLRWQTEMSALLAEWQSNLLEDPIAK